MRLCTVFFLVLSASAAAAAQPSVGSGNASVLPKPAQLPADSLSIGRKFAYWFYSGYADSLFAHADSATRARYESPAGIEEDIASFAGYSGSEVKVVSEQFVTRNGKRQYWRKATFSTESDPLLIRFVISARGEFLGLGIGPASQPPPIDP